MTRGEVLLVASLGIFLCITQAVLTYWLVQLHKFGMFTYQWMGRLEKRE